VIVIFQKKCIESSLSSGALKFKLCELCNNDYELCNTVLEF